MREWTRTDLSYDARVKSLAKGVTAADGSSVHLDNHTVHEDGAGDVLRGEFDSDWFFLTALEKKPSDQENGQETATVFN
jgi:hypothetical protein